MIPEPIPDSLEKFRVDGPARSVSGQFKIQGPCGRQLLAQGSNGAGWDHVSVSTQKHIPNWMEMDFIYHLFFQPNEVAVQYHLQGDAKVNQCERCLHIWRPQSKDEAEQIKKQWEGQLETYPWQIVDNPQIVLPPKGLV